MKHVNVALFVPHEGCPNQCSFCNQRAISGKKTQVTPADVDKAVEIALRNPDSKGGEIAFFGGSFTAIRRSTMVSLLEAAHRYISDGSFRGIRISTRPDAVDEEICGILRHYGVTAVELGAQSLDDRVLTLNKRGHTAEDVASATRLLKKYGFETGLQMMTGLYGSEDADSIETAERIIRLAPDTVRIYPTVVIKGTKLYELMQSGNFSPKGIEETVELCARLIPMFENAGIKVIRVGLHSGGGAYHPALRELCEGRIYYNAALGELEKLRKGSYVLSVNGREISKMTGQKKQNLKRLAEAGYECRVVGNDSLQKGEIEIEVIE